MCLVQSRKAKLLLAFLAVIGTTLIFVPAWYNTRIEDDGFSYISTARSLIAGDGFIDYHGGPYFKWAPLYPALLALFGIIFKIDPLILAYFLNAIIFGLIVYFGGALAFRHLSSFPTLAVLGTLAILFSIPLFQVSTQAWSESVFITLVILSFIFGESYISANDRMISLVCLALTVALACLQRYVGVSLIVWGALIILLFGPYHLRSRLAHLSLFVFISSLSLGAWLIRNFIVVGGILATRDPPKYTFLQNLISARQGIGMWFGSGVIGEASFAFIIVTIAIGVFTSIKDWSDAKVSKDRNPSILFIVMSGAFCIIFITFVATACASTRCLTDGPTRTLSPIYIPLTLLFLVSVQMLITRYCNSFQLNSIMVIGFVIWLVYPIRANVLYAMDLIQGAQKINTQAWQDSETIQYLRQNPNLKSECKKIYTNDVSSTFVLARLSTERSLSQYHPLSQHEAMPKLVGFWPPEDKACLVWYKYPAGLDYFPAGLGYFTFDELQEIANVKLMVQLNDGAIYSMTRR